MTVSNEVIEPHELPVFPVIIEALTLPFRRPLVAAASLGIVLSGGLLLLGLVWLVAGNPFANGENGLFNPEASIVLLTVAVFIIVAAVLVGIFNLWARLAIMGDSRAWQQPVGSWARQIFGNAVNFLWIGIVVGIIVGFIMFVPSLIFAGGIAAMTAVMFGGGGSPGMVAVMAVGGFLLAIAIAWLTCYFYARFSLTIVEGALGERYVSSTRPREVIAQGALRFSIVLVVVYAVGLLVQSLASALGTNPSLLWIRGAIELGLYLYGIAVIAAAHGIVFRLKTGRMGIRAEEIDAAAVAVPGAGGLG